MWLELPGTTTMKEAEVLLNSLLVDVIRLMEEVLEVIILPFGPHDRRSPTIFATTRFHESRSLPQGSSLYR
jgi:hypothetical protein